MVIIILIIVNIIVVSKFIRGKIVYNSAPVLYHFAISTLTAIILINYPLSDRLSPLIAFVFLFALMMPAWMFRNVQDGDFLSRQQYKNISVFYSCLLLFSMYAMLDFASILSITAAVPEEYIFRFALPLALMGYGFKKSQADIFSTFLFVYCHPLNDAIFVVLASIIFIYARNIFGFQAAIMAHMFWNFSMTIIHF